MKKRLVRDEQNKILGGVMAGWAKYLGHDATVWRLVLVFAVLLSGFFPGIILYLVAWIIMPAGTDEPYYSYEVKD